MALQFCISLTFLCFLPFLATTAARDRERRELPLSTNCDPRVPRSCYKGDLIANHVANCNRHVSSILNVFTCDPINNLWVSSVVDVPDVSRRGVNCVPERGLPVVCGAQGTDTRCVCDKPADIRRLQLNQCRCQYWPTVDVRANWPSYCTQYDHGGVSNVHFYICCNNCNDPRNTCDAHTYDGGSSVGYCGKCGAPKGGGRITYRFNCGSCAQQAQCERKCSYADFPGLCPRWAGCFRRCCTAAQSRRSGRYCDKLDDIGDFCGDFVCQEGEDHISCPFDCCASYNPTNCSQCITTSSTTTCNLCSPSCCEESHCCLPDDEE